MSRIKQSMGVIAPAIIFGICSFIFLRLGDTLIAVIWGTLAATIFVYFIFPQSDLAKEALRDRSARRRPRESIRSFHFRVAGYWAVAGAFFLALVLVGIWISPKLPGQLTQHGAWGAVFYFIAPILGLTFMLKALGGLWKAYRRSSDES